MIKDRRNKLMVILALIIFVCSAIIVLKLNKDIYESYNFESGLVKYQVFNPVLPDDNKIEGTQNITFDAFFLADEDSDGQAESYHGATIPNGNSEEIYFSLNITGDVSLENAKLSFDNSNVIINGTLPKGSLFDDSTYLEDIKTLDLKTIGNGVSSFFYFSVFPNVENDLNDFDGTNKVILTGDVVDNITGERTSIRKEISYEVKTFIDKISTLYSQTKAQTENNSFVVRYTFVNYEGYGLIPLLESHIEGSISSLLEDKPLSVRISAAGSDNYTYTYNEDTQTFSAVKTAQIEDNIIKLPAYSKKSKKTRYTTWYIDVEYARNENASKEFVSATATSWYVGMKNSDNETIESERRTSIVSQQIDAMFESYDGFRDNSKVTLGTYVNSEDEYFVDKTPIVAPATGPSTEELYYDQIYNLSSVLSKNYDGYANYEERYTKIGNVDFTNYTSYKSVKVYKLLSGPSSSLTIKNADTNETIFVVNSSNLGKELLFPENIHRIRVETSKLPAGTSTNYNLMFVKEIDVKKVTSDFDINNFNYGNITNTIDTWQKIDENESSTTVNQHGSAVFAEKISFATIDTDKYSYYREPSTLNIPIELELSTNNAEASHSYWNGGIFLVKIPDIIMDVDNITASAKYTGTSVLSTEKIKIGNDNFIRIAFDTSSTATVNVSFDAIMDPRNRSTSASFELYSYNNKTTIYRNSVEDIYDIDSDEDLSEYITKSIANFNITYPNEVSTWETLENYNSNVSYSGTPSPLIADVDPLRDEKDADLRITVSNNSENVVKDIYVIGKTGFTGNTYQIGDGELGTEFDSYMDGPITYDSSLNGKVHIYYSSKSNPTNDVNNPLNEWVENPVDYKTVKSYLIVLDSDLELGVGEELNFVYPVELPVTTENLNKVSYFTHGAYFNYVTDSGLYPSSVSGFKLGARIARLYSIDFNLYKLYSDNVLLRGGSYVIYPKNNPDDARTITFNNSGFATINDIYVDTEYMLKQVTPAKDSVIDTTTRSFKISNGVNDELTLSNSNNFRKIEKVSDTKLNIELENEVTYWVILNSVDISDHSNVSAIYKITGKNYENGYYLNTKNLNGYPIVNFVPGEVYHVKQTYADGYAKTKEFDFKLVRDLDDHTFDLTTRLAPTITRGDNCNTSDIIFSTNYNGVTVRSNRVYPSEAKDIKCNVSINLAGYKDRYKLSGSAIVYDDYTVDNSSKLKISLSKNIDYETSPYNYILEKDPSATYYADSLSYVDKDMEFTNAYTTDGNNIVSDELTGGSNYNLYLLYNRSGYNGGQNNTPYYNVSSLKLENLDNEVELYQNKTKSHLQSSDNPNVYQYVSSDGINAGTPMLILEINNKKVEQRDFELVTLDSTNGEPIKNAVFKLSGPNVPEGTTLTSDDNGKANIKLNLSYSGYYNDVPGVGDNSEYPVTNLYTLQQIYTPDGYTMEGSLIEFKIEAYYPSYNSEPEYRIVTTNNNRFKATSVRMPLVFSATVENYPLFTLVKTDEETGEFLANTYYSIERVNPVTLELEPAKDTYGNIIGERFVIDNKELYLIKTDENGSFRLQLMSGTYKITEVIPSDDKYDITDQVKYFTIGDVKSYQASGTSIKNIKTADDDITSNVNRYTYTTSDGGVILIAATGDNTDKTEVLKYDKNLNLVWRTRLLTNNRSDPEAQYFDRPGVRTVYALDIPDDAFDPKDNPNTERITVSEEEDSYYVNLSKYQLFRLDKDSGDIIFGPTDHPRVKAQITYYKALCDKQDGVYYNHYELKPGDDEHVYCNPDQYLMVNFANYSGQGSFPLTFDSNSSGALQLGVLPKANIYNGNKNGNAIELSDGTLITNDDYDGYRLYVIKVDKDGKWISADSISEKINSAYKKYMVDNNLGTEQDEYTSDAPNMYQAAYFGKIKYFDDGSYIILISNISFKKVGTYQTTETAIAIKVNADGTVGYFTPLGINGMGVLNSSVLSTLNQTYWNINEDGSFDVNYAGGLNIGNYDRDDTSIFDTDNLHLDIQPTRYEVEHNMSTSRSWINYSMLHFDSNAKLKSQTYITYSGANAKVSYATGYTADDYRDDEIYYNTIAHKTTNPYFISRVSDGYIVALSYQTPGSEAINDYERMIILKDGETYYLRRTENPIIYLYKITDDNKIEWIKEYVLGDNEKLGYSMSNISNNYFTLGIMTNVKQIKDSNSEEYITPKDSNLPSNLMITQFEVKDEQIPDAPIAINIDWSNFRKKYGIYLDTNKYSNVSVNTVNTDTNAEYMGPITGQIETVKHGDDSVLNIKIIPSSGYYVKSIKINDEYINFKSTIDGNVDIPQIKNITEDKHIYIEVDSYESKVLVHHYLNGTTTPIAPDDTITGTLGEVYQTYPANSSEYELIKNENNEYIYPEEYTGHFKASPIEVVYYYEKYANLQVNYVDKDTFMPILNPFKSRKVSGSSYTTSPEDIFRYSLYGVEGDENGILNNSYTEVTYLYNRLNQTAVITKYLDIDTNEELSDTLYDYYDRGLTYYTNKLATNPDHYEYVSSTNNESGTVGSTDIEVIYYYRKVKGKVISKYIDVSTGNSIAIQDEQFITYGGNYNAKPLANIPDGYEFVRVQGNEHGTVSADEIVVTYFYKMSDATDPKYGKVITKYVDVDTGLDIIISNVQTLLYNSTYEAVKKLDSFDGYDYIGVEGNETGIVDKDQIVIKYKYKKKSLIPVNPPTDDKPSNKDDDVTPIIKPHNDKEEESVVNPTPNKSESPFTADNIQIYFVILGVSALLLIILVVSKVKSSKKKANKKPIN